MCRPIERAEKIATLPYGNAARSEITDFRIALPTVAVSKENNRLEREFSLTASPQRPPFIRRTGTGKTKIAASPPQIQI